MWYRWGWHAACVSDKLLQDSFHRGKFELKWSWAAIKGDLAVNISDGDADRSGFIVVIDLAVHSVDNHRYGKFILSDTCGCQDNPLIEGFWSANDTCFIALSQLLGVSFADIND